MGGSCSVGKPASLDLAHIALSLLSLFIDLHQYKMSDAVPMVSFQESVLGKSKSVFA